MSGHRRRLTQPYASKAGAVASASSRSAAGSTPSSSEVMRRHAAAAGLEDAVIVNTCAVTGRGGAPGDADHPQAQARESRPRASSSPAAPRRSSPQRFADMPEVDRVIGNAEKMRPEHLPRPELRRQPARRRSTTSCRCARRRTPWSTASARARAPTCRCRTAAITAAPSASFRSAAGRRARCRRARWWRSVRRLVEAGYAEVVLTGVDITDYGADLPGDMSLGKLVRQILRHVPELDAPAPLLHRPGRGRRASDRRHRRGAAPDAASAPVAAVGRRHDPQAHEAAAFPRRCRAFLRRGAAAAARHRVRRRPDRRLSRPRRRPCSPTPCGLVDDCGLTFLHVFPFSPRPGTPAARMPQVARVRRSRSGRRGCGQKGEAALAALPCRPRSAREVELLIERDAARAHARLRRDGARREPAPSGSCCGPASPGPTASGCRASCSPPRVRRERHARQIPRSVRPLSPRRGAASPLPLEPRRAAPRLQRA